MKFFAFGNLIFLMKDSKSTQFLDNLHISFVKIEQAVRDPNLFFKYFFLGFGMTPI